MNDRPTQIIPDPNAVARCLDGEILEILDSHGTFTISELLEKMISPNDSKISRAELDYVFDKSRNGGNYHRDDFFANLTDILSKDTDITGLLTILVNGTNCNLLQPDGKGWQKGKLKICFEFIPEEDAPVVVKETPIKTHFSSLDEIRKLADELQSARAIKQN
jgi:hypothetical protein